MRTMLRLLRTLPRIPMMQKINNSEITCHNKQHPKQQ